MLLVQNAVLQVGLRERSINLIYLADLDVLRDHSMPRQLGLPVGAMPVFTAFDRRRRLLATLLKIDLTFGTLIKHGTIFAHLLRHRIESVVGAR